MGTFANIRAKPCYILSLESCGQRRITSRVRAEEAGYTDIVEIDAINGKTTDMDAMWKMIFKSVPERNELCLAAQGCFLTHAFLWKNIVENEIDVCTVFEDDILFHPRWHELVEYYYSLTPKDFEILYLGSELHKKYHKGRAANMVESLPVFCTHAYVITLEGAKKLLKAVKSRPFMPLDLVIWDIMYNERNICDFKWYSWQASMYPTVELRRMHPRWQQKNTGLVYQDYSAGSLINPSLWTSTRSLLQRLRECIIR